MVQYSVTNCDAPKTKRSTDPLKKHEHSQQGRYKALEYLHGQAYPIAEYKRSVHPMAEYKRSVLNRLGSFMNSDPTDHVLTYIYDRPRTVEGQGAFSSKPVFET